MKVNKLNFLILFLISLNVFSQNQVKPLRFEADKLEYTFKKGSEKTVCKGNAKIWRDDFILKASLINLYGKNNDFAEAFNNVVIISPQHNSIIKSDYAEYDNIKGVAKVFKNPVLEFTNRKLVIKAAVMEHYVNEEISVGLGDVTIVDTNWNAQAEKGVYYQKMEKIELTGNPVVNYEGSTFQSKKVVVYINEKRIKLYGDVESIILTKGKKK